jgi:hypothetical protein
MKKIIMTIFLCIHFVVIKLNFFLTGKYFRVKENLLASVRGLKFNLEDYFTDETKRRLPEN